MLELTTLIQRAPHVTHDSSLNPTREEYRYAMEKLRLNLHPAKKLNLPTTYTHR